MGLRYGFWLIVHRVKSVKWIESVGFRVERQRRRPFAFGALVVDDVAATFLEI